MQKDYYALYGVFASSVEPTWKDLPVLPSASDPANDAEYQKQLGDLESQLGKFLDTQRQVFAMRTIGTLGVPAIIPPESRRSCWISRGNRIR
ncbi:MAG: hypothetical protein WDN28_34000 [Chthoniobacter sp.]